MNSSDGGYSQLIIFSNNNEFCYDGYIIKVLYLFFVKYYINNGWVDNDKYYYIFDFIESEFELFEEYYENDYNYAFDMHWFIRPIFIRLLLYRKLCYIKMGNLKKKLCILQL